MNIRDCTYTVHVGVMLTANQDGVACTYCGRHYETEQEAFAHLQRVKDEQEFSVGIHPKIEGR